MKKQYKFIDLSIYLENDVLSDPPPLAPKITYQKHADTLPEFMAMLPGTKVEDYPFGCSGFAVRVVFNFGAGQHRHELGQGISVLLVGDLGGQRRWVR